MFAKRGLTVCKNCQIELKRMVTGNFEVSVFKKMTQYHAHILSFENSISFFILVNNDFHSVIIKELNAQRCCK